MTGNQLERFLGLKITDESTLVRFIECAKLEVRALDESSAAGVALSCDEKLWGSPMIQQLVQDTVFENFYIGLVCKLLGSGILTPALAGDLSTLLRKEQFANWRIESLFELIVILHRRKMVDAKQLLLPHLGWFSKMVLWETAILTFRVCAPSLLHDKKLMLAPRLRSRRCRVLIDILSAEMTADKSKSSGLFRKAVSGLHRLKSNDHGMVVLRIASASMIETNGLAARLSHEMAVIGDRRDLQYLAAAAQVEAYNTRY